MQILFISDCIPPYTLSFNTNSEAVENPAATSAQGGKIS